MRDWSYRLANEFKQRNNPLPMGAIIGKIEKLSPLTVSIQSGKFILQENQLYVCNQLLERKSDFIDLSADQKQSGSISVSCQHGGGSYSANGSINANGSIHLLAVWKIGDYVLIIPDATEQHFFVVDILRKVDNYNSELR